MMSVSGSATQAMSTSMPAIDHSMHEMALDPSSSQQDADPASMMKDCCSAGGNCSMMSCFFSLMNNQIDIKTIQASNLAVVIEYSMIPRQSAASLYRPPILA